MTNEENIKLSVHPKNSEEKNTHKYFSSSNLHVTSTISEGNAIGVQSY